MKDPKILTDVELRAHWFRTGENVYYVQKDVSVTPSAQDFLKEHGIELRCTSECATMSVSPIPMEQGKAKYLDLATGEPLYEKPEHMTHLSGNRLVPKTHPRIIFRGKLDALMAQMLGVQMVAAECGKQQVADELEELLDYLRQMMAAEVKEVLLDEVHLLGMDSKTIRETSHNVKEHFGIAHPVPHYRMGRLCVALNRLRTQVREVELCAAQAFVQGQHVERADIIQGLNRLSSCVYIIFCRLLSSGYDEVKP